MERRELLGPAKGKEVYQRHSSERQVKNEVRRISDVGSVELAQTQRSSTQGRCWDDSLASTVGVRLRCPRYRALSSKRRSNRKHQCLGLTRSKCYIKRPLIQSPCLCRSGASFRSKVFSIHGLLAIPIEWDVDRLFALSGYRT